MAHMPKRTSKLARLLVVAVLVAPAGVSAAPWEFEPRVALGEVWTDNVALAPDGLEESEWITELRPGFTLATDGPRARIDLDYDLQALWYADNDDLDDVYHMLDGDGNFVLAADSLFLDAFARYGQLTIDTSGDLVVSNLYETDNRTDAFVFGAVPYHLGRWGSWGESEVRYQYQGVRYDNAAPGVLPPEDSDTSAIFASLGSPAAARGFSWQASGSYNRTDFDVSREFEYARVNLDLGVPVGLRTRLIGTIGQESDVDQDPSAGGLDSSYWYAGFAWQPSDLQSLEVQVGQRFFGTSWDIHWRRRGSRGELTLDYTEEPTTSAGVLGDDGVFRPGFEGGGVGSLDTRVFVWSRLSGSARYEFARSTIDIALYADRREYQDTSGGTEDGFGARLIHGWDVASRTQLNTVLEWTRTEPEAGSENDYGQLSIAITRELTRTLSGVVRFGHFLLNSNTDDDYNTNYASLFLEASF